MDMSIRPSGTTAASTAFCATQLNGDDGRHLWIDGNGKITAGNGTLDAPQPNAFSIVQVQDCPFRTPSCSTACYVHNLEKFAPDTYKLYQHNSATIREILDLDEAVRDRWACRMGAFIGNQCKGGFRWHVSGDVFSLRYADFIAHVCQLSPSVRHWIYTRSFPYVSRLMPASLQNGGNLAINLSIDKDNYVPGSNCAAEFGLRRCVMAVGDGAVPTDLRKGDVIFPDYSLRGGTPEGMTWFETLPAPYKQMVCPVDFHGKSEERRCGRCARCLT